MYVMGASKATGSTFMQTMLPVSAPAAKKLYVAKLKNKFIRAMFNEKAHLHTSRDCSHGKIWRKSTVACQQRLQTSGRHIVLLMWIHAS